jgi:PilZ domain-containing protein
VSSLPTASENRTAESRLPAEYQAKTTRTNRRSQQRIAVNTHLFVSFQDGKGVQHRIRARAMDLSKSGVLVQSDEPVPLGQVVYLQTPSFIAMGRASIRHCTQKGLKYVIGLYIPDPLVRGL